MNKRNWEDIKSILHFDFPYFNEPNDGLGDEASSETWAKSGNTSLAGTQNPYAAYADPKFGYRCAYFPNTSSYITGTNTNGTFNISTSGSYEIEAFIKFNGTGNIFIFGDLVLAIDTSGCMTLLGQTASTAFTAGTWQHVLLRIAAGTCTVYLDGVGVLSATLTTDITPEFIQLGGFVGYMDEFVFRTSAGTNTPTVPTEPYNATLNVNALGGFGTGSDGDVTISANTNLNSYGVINSITNPKTFSVSSWNYGAYTPAVGREIMIHGTGTDYSKTGLYAFAKIARISGVHIGLKQSITTENGFDFTLDNSLLSTSSIEVIINTLTVNANISPTGGGIVAFRCKGDCTINGSIITHGYGSIRNDTFQMENSKLINRFLCAQGGGIFITCGGTFSAIANARLGATWSGEELQRFDFAGTWTYESKSGYGGDGGHVLPCSSSITSTNSYKKLGALGGVGGGGGGAACTNMSTTTGEQVYGAACGKNGSNAKSGAGGGGCGGNGGNGSYAGGSGGGGQGNSAGIGGTGNEQKIYNRKNTGNSGDGINGGRSTFYDTNPNSTTRVCSH